MSVDAGDWHDCETCYCLHDMITCAVETVLLTATLIKYAVIKNGEAQCNI